MAAVSPRSLSARHIQNFSEAASLEPHWGYADRAVPCTNDAGSCEYLDVVYHSHDLGMLYAGIFWATIGGILLVWAIGRRFFPSVRSNYIPTQPGEQPLPPRSTAHRLRSSIASYSRRYLLPDFARPIFGRTTRLQVLILVILTSYITIWTFVGIVYKKWVTPVKKMPGVYNTRTSLGPWSDRIGVLAYALTPLSVLLSSRESLLSLFTGIPYQHFNFLHRWLGYIIFVQSSLHTIGWCIIEARLYQPQPIVGNEWIKQVYMIWGVVAMILITFLFVLSTPWGIRATGYEFFRKAHYVLAMVYVGACWAHWAQLNCFMIPSLVIWLLDRAVRLARTALLHYNYLPTGGMGFSAAKANVTLFPSPENTDDGDVVRLDFDHPHDAWDVGQHFYLCFPQGSIWQSHPFTPLSLPTGDGSKQRHSYVFRAKKGETKKLAQLAVAMIDNQEPIKEGSKNTSSITTTPVVLNGPYGRSTINHLSTDVNVLCVAGGTGITFVLPVLLHLANEISSSGRMVELIWVVRRNADVAWVQKELDELHLSRKSLNLTIRIFVTRDGQHFQGPAPTPEKQDVAVSAKVDAASSQDSQSGEISGTGSLPRAGSFLIEETAPAGASPEIRHPDIGTLVSEFIEGTGRGRTAIYASGPGGMISDLRKTVAQCNSGQKVWKGDERFDVQFICDDRLEW